MGARGPTRRDVIRSAAILPVAAQLKPTPRPAAGSRPVVIAAKTYVKTAARAFEILSAGGDPIDAILEGIHIVENDPEDVTVGYGGIPNEEGVVQLDAAVMDGRTMKSGAVGALEGIKNPTKVARLVMERTNRAFIVGEGALRFAKAHGFAEENLLTPRAQKIWLYWKEKLSRHDDWIEAGSEEQKDPDIRWYIEKYGVSDFRPQGTVNCNAVTANGDVVGATSTSGLFFKLPGRLGDTPVIGAGLYLDNDIGACGSTGWGEGNIRGAGSHTVVELMRQGKSPEEAALETLKRIVAFARDNREDSGRPKFQTVFYAVNKRGEYAGASVYDGIYGSTGKFSRAQFAIAESSGARLLETAYLYKREPPKT
jgi:N4-(beta-N-acetylglucosaminyl)-L-asparaginase